MLRREFKLRSSRTIDHRGTPTTHTAAPAADENNPETELFEIVFRTTNEKEKKSSHHSSR